MSMNKIEKIGVPSTGVNPNSNIFVGQKSNVAYLTQDSNNIYNGVNPNNVYQQPAVLTGPTAKQFEVLGVASNK